MLPPIRYILQDLQAPLLKEIYEDLDALEDLCELVTKAIREDPPLAMKEGNIIRDGYNEEVDKLRRGEIGRKKTGLQNLRMMSEKKQVLKI